MRSELKGYLVLESGEVFSGNWHGDPTKVVGRAGEVVFNTSHAGYEEIATDPSYYSQIMVMTATQMGNYGVDRAIWESRQMWIEGFVACEVQHSLRDAGWEQRLLDHGIPVLSGLDTRRIVLRLRDFGTPWGALVAAKGADEAKTLAFKLIDEKKKIERDWVYTVSRRDVEVLKGQNAKGPRVALLDFGAKENILRELVSRCAEVGVFPSRTPDRVIRDWNPSGILLSNGPGDPADVKESTETVRSLLGWKPVFGICMGHQILARALGASTYKLKFGHRGGNHPVKDELTNQIYVTSQNHGYAVNADTLPSGSRVTHWNLNDKTVEGLEFAARKCMSVQFHPESHPGPREASLLFDYFVNGL
jgi:carbamoyl-phosphate synthase small subunit